MCGRTGIVSGARLVQRMTCTVVAGFHDGAVCGGHGVCNAVGACDCMDSAQGHWASPNCTVCAVAWSGSGYALPQIFSFR